MSDHILFTVIVFLYCVLICYQHYIITQLKKEINRLKVENSSLDKRPIFNIIEDKSLKSHEWYFLNSENDILRKK